MKDGEWRTWVFPMANKIIKFPTHVIRENRKLRMQVTIFVTKMSSSASNMAKLFSKKKHDFSVLLMTTYVFSYNEQDNTMSKV